MQCVHACIYCVLVCVWFMYVMNACVWYVVFAKNCMHICVMHVCALGHTHDGGYGTNTSRSE